LLRGAPLIEAEGWLAERLGRTERGRKGFIRVRGGTAGAGSRRARAQRQRDLEAARRLAESEGQRAEEAGQAVGRLRRRALLPGRGFVSSHSSGRSRLPAFSQADQNGRVCAASKPRAGPLLKPLALGERATATRQARWRWSSELPQKQPGL